MWLGWVSSTMMSQRLTVKRDGEVVPRNTQEVTDKGHSGLPAPQGQDHICYGLALLGPASGTEHRAQRLRCSVTYFLIHNFDLQSSLALNLLCSPA